MAPTSPFRNIAEMASDEDLRSRIVAGAAMAGIASPDLWVGQRIWRIVGRNRWADAWAGRLPAATNSDAISDAWILAAVRAVSNSDQGGNANE